MNRIDVTNTDLHTMDARFPDGKPLTADFKIEIKIDDKTVDRTIIYDFEKLSYARVSAAIQAFSAYDEMEINPPRSSADMQEAFKREAEQIALSAILIDKFDIDNGSDEYNSNYKETIPYKALSKICGKSNFDKLELCKISFFCSVGLISSKYQKESENTLKQLVESKVITQDTIAQMLEGKLTPSGILDSINQIGSESETIFGEAPPSSGKSAKSGTTKGKKSLK